MNRNDKILYHINKTTNGVEVGPSHNPIAPKKEGYKVHIIDHMNRENLIKKYKEHNVNFDNIEDVDFVWNGESYSDLTGRTKFYDWIIASHVIEHTPDLIGFLNDCDAIIKDNAVISLVVPDKRYCFDHFRPITGLSKIIDSHFKKEKIHTEGTVAEFFLNTVSKAGQFAWSADSSGEYHFGKSPLEKLEKAKNAIDSVQKKEFIDVHAWCFTPHSFRLIIHDLYELGFIPFKEVSFFPTDGCEFYMTLGREGKGCDIGRLELLKIIESEMSMDISVTMEERQLAERDTQLAERDAQLAAVYSSTSWRITAPIRFIKRKFMELFRRLT